MVSRGERFDRAREVIERILPRTACRLVKEWALACAGEQPQKIAGLDAD
jgi:hypothetical protein